MTFGNPLFLWSLVLLSVPILIHLFRFRKYKKVYFTRAVLLEKSVSDQRRVKNLKHILILVSRVLSLLLFIWAFSLPYFIKNGQKTSQILDDSHLILVVDNHLGMYFNDEDKTGRLYAVKQQIKSLLKNLNSFSKISLVTLNSAPQTFNSIDEALTAIESLSPTAAIGSWYELNSKIQRVTRSQENKPNILLFSDFLNKNDDLKQISIKFTPVIVPSFDFNTLQCIDSLWEFPIASGSFYFQLKGDTSNAYPVVYGEKKPIFSAERTKEMPNVYSFRFPANMNFTYGIITPQNSFNPAQNFFFIPSTMEKKSILLLYNNKKLSDLYKSKFFNMQTVEVDHFTFDDVKSINFLKYNHVILIEVEKIDDRLSRELQEFLKRNTRVFLVPSSDADLTSINRFLQNYGLNFTQQETVITEAEKIEYQDLLFRNVFEEEYELPHLPFFKKYYNVEVSNGIPIIYTISGKNMLVKTTSMNGGILYVSSGSFHPENSDILMHEIFSPMIYNFLHRDMTISMPYYLCGQDYTFNFSLAVKNHDESIKLKTPMQEEIIPLQTKRGSDFSVTLGKEFLQNGIYSLWYDGEKIKDIAFNLPVCKLNNRYYTPKDLASDGVIDLSDIMYLTDNNILSRIQASTGVQLWVYFVTLGILLLFVELSIIKFLK
ncbi:BatA domain-containing protein [Schleiferia thermophila]|uniref:BatA domain-containing protein n=1 Tax=Schleiferia thermophila TaxID=884107 RepID=UPI003EEA4DB5